MARKRAKPLVNPTVGQAVGDAIRHLRERDELTQQEVAMRVQGEGLAWTPDVVAAFESGRRDEVTLSELVILSQAFGTDLADWFAGDGWLQLTRYARVDRLGMRELLTGEGAAGSFVVDFSKAPAAMVIASLRGFARMRLATEAEAHAASRLGASVPTIVVLAEKLWGRRLDEERERRLGDAAALPVNERRARRGRVTRQLIAEMGRALGQRAARGRNKGGRK